MSKTYEAEYKNGEKFLIVAKDFKTAIKIIKRITTHSELIRLEDTYLVTIELGDDYAIAVNVTNIMPNFKRPPTKKILLGDWQENGEPMFRKYKFKNETERKKLPWIDELDKEILHRRVFDVIENLRDSMMILHGVISK